MFVRKVGIFMLLIVIIGITGLAGEKVLLIEDFQTLSNWVQSPEIKVLTNKYGFEPSKGEEGARMWYLGSKDFRDCYYWYAYNMKPIDVSEFDYILIEFRLGEGTRLTIDIWFDGKQVEPRPVNYVMGTGNWQVIKIPITGTKLTLIALSISELSSDTGEDKIYEAYFKKIEAVKENNRKDDKIVQLPDIIVIPTPKEIRITGKTINLTPFSEVSIIIKENASETERISAEELAEEIRKLSGNTEKINIFASDAIPMKYNVIFVIGVNHPVFEKFGVKSPLKKEGYTVKMFKNSGKDIILLSGTDKTGVYWAVQTILQLLEKKGDKVILHVCDINDWPTYLYRSLAVSSDREANIKALRYKINVLFNPWWSLPKNWREPDERYIKTLQEETEFCAKRGVTLTQQICPYNVNYKGEKIDQIQISNSADIDKLFQIYKLSLSKGSRIINLSFDDPSREVKSFHPEDIKFFNGDIPKGHAYLVSELYKRMKKEYPDAILTVVPRNYESPIDIKGHYNEMKVPKKDVVIMWTGSAGVTLSYNEEQIRHFKNDIEGREFIVFDNTPGQMYGYGKRIQMFDNYASGYNNLWKYCYGIHGMHRMANPPTPCISDIQGMIMAEYMWNADRYNAEITVKKVLAKVAGKSSVEPLLSFKEYYLKIATKYPVWKKPEELSIKEKTIYRISEEKYYNYIKPNVDKLKENLEKIKMLTLNQELIKDLETRYNWVVKDIEILRENSKVKKLFKPGEEILLLPEDFLGGTGYEIYSYLCEPKNAVWIYGQKTPLHTLEAEFELAYLPQNDGILIIEGQDDEKEGKTKIEISLNGHVVFCGPNEFKEKGWSTCSFTIKKSFWDLGKNILKIRNLEEGDSFNSKWFMLTYAKITFF